MKGTQKPRTKICCIGSVKEAEMAIELGASALGLVGNMPSGPGVIPDDKIAEIASIIPSSIASFLLEQILYRSLINYKQEPTKISAPH